MPCPPVIRVDTTKLRQILFNLLSNAFKFTTLGSVSVAITCEILDRENAILIFHIEDTGTGITELDKASIFQAFYRGNSPNSLIDGTGLGLNLTQQYVQLLGGEIMLESEVQQGTCIYFYVPVKILETETQFNFALSNMQSIKPEKSNQRIPLIFEDIKNLSPQWCQVFYEALTDLDDRKMLALLIEIQPQYPELAQLLEKLINAVEIQLLIDLFASFSLEDNREF
jgi:anti-sigma regulatory factor (Ser/Thr protein kinase)